MDKLALIVLNYNVYQETIACVEQLLSLDGNFKIVIVDNQSSNDSFLVLKEQFKNNQNIAVILADENGGYSKGNNLGCCYAIENYNSRYLGIINPDVRINDLKTLYHMINVMDKYKNCAVIGASMISGQKRYLPGASAWHIPSRHDIVLGLSLRYNGEEERNSTYEILEEGIAEVGCVHGSFFIAKTELFKRVGMFDENVYLYNEENILGIKCKKAGYKVLWSMNDYYYHNHNYTQRKALKNIVAIMRAKYQSRKYLLTQYYDKNIYDLLVLKLINWTNILIVIAGNLKNYLMQIGAKNKN
ncbi:glycosyltransferase [Ligilactobacillus equi]|uniref:Rhamnosyl transferase n=1 Tax=Ligilactobacillus equi DPC 6820 TaxID=1392007 RepID=V7HZ49_9LACO|nr:glycosyltransferase family 2 protein [Ligilactobacillus equi]ETA74473.1 rhamnosyl transferase [Ligilactobacillus equi DPC 6820]